MIEQVKNTIGSAIQDLTSELIKIEDFFTVQEKSLEDQVKKTNQVSLSVTYSGYTPQIWLPKPKRDWLLFPPIPEHIAKFIKEFKTHKKTQRLWTGDGAIYWNHKNNLIDTFISANQNLIDIEFQYDGVVDLLSHNICNDQVNLKRTPKGFFETDNLDHLTRAFRRALDHKIRELIKEKSNTVSDLIQELKPLSHLGFDTTFGWDESPEANQMLEGKELEKMKQAFAWSKYQRQQTVTDSDGFNWNTGQIEP